jgi:hypothetical protein
MIRDPDWKKLVNLPHSLHYALLKKKKKKKKPPTRTIKQSKNPLYACH